MAIVYSGLNVEPADKVKAFRIKDEYMDEVENCKKTGFHEHSIPSRYMSEECPHADLYDPQTAKNITIRLDDYRKQK